jgi:predicted nuclease with TOPRIM domain
MVSVLLNGEMYEVEPAVKAYIDELMIENAELRKENNRLEGHNLDLQAEFCKQGAKIDELKKENARLEEGYQKSVGVIAADTLPTLAEMRKVSEMCRTTKCKQCGYFDKKEHRCRFDDGADHWNFGGADNADSGKSV